jgi:hypothetical protein
MVSFHRFRRLLPFIIGVLGFGVQAFAEWNEKVLYSFQGIPDGSMPAGGVVFDSAGNLYGATTEGGADNCPGIAQCGTVFQLKPPTKKGGAWAETVLHVFKGKTANDGSTPAGGVILDKQGNIYGTTGYGGTGDCVLLGGNVGCGTVYELSPPKEKDGKWTETILYSFRNADNGWLPQGDLTFDAAGNLYGATEFGGGKGTACNSLYGGQCGTVFELSPPTKSGGRWTEKVLHRFAGIASAKSEGDGAEPNGGLIFNKHGTIYGTAGLGGSSTGEQCHGGNGFVGCGCVFSLHPPVRNSGAWKEAVLYRFRGNPGDGTGPADGVTFDAEGRMYGTTRGGGKPEGDGTAFRLAPTKDDSWNEQILHTFGFGSAPATPWAGLAFGKSGDLFGTTSGGGKLGDGTAFVLSPRSGHWSLSILYIFRYSPDGASPAAKLILDGAGNFYGTTQQGGNNGRNCGRVGCGTVFELSP